jgi:tRNA(Leu) C34 or U34 (ribose-2'-O)-methylase TrmL
MKHSLNIAVSVGVVIWDLVCKMRKWIIRNESPFRIRC